MFLSLMQFLFTSRSEIVMVNAYEWKELLDNLSLKVNNSFNPAENNINIKLFLLYS